MSESFLKPSPKKLVLTLALLATIPVPFSAGLAGGVGPFLYAILPISAMAAVALIDMQISISLLFIGQLIFYPSIAYLSACFVYKLIQYFNGQQPVTWLHIIVVTLFLGAVYMLSVFTGITYVMA